MIGFFKFYLISLSLTMVDCELIVEVEVFTSGFSLVDKALIMQQYLTFTWIYIDGELL